MERKIVEYYKDELDDWVAGLSCGHGQHVRHKPPFVNRPWVLTEEGRDSKLFSILNCIRCEQLELPTRLGAGERSIHLSGATIPDEWLDFDGVRFERWAKLTMLEGSMIISFHFDDKKERLVSAGADIVLVPDLPISFKPAHSPLFFIEHFGFQSSTQKKVLELET